MTFRRIFIRAPNWVGDLVMATSAFARVRAAFPDAEIIGGMRSYLRPLVAGTDWFDDIAETPKVKGWRDLRTQVRALRDRQCDLALVLPNSIESGLVPRLAGVPERIGYRQGRSWLMTGGPRATPGRSLWGHLRRRGPRRLPRPMPDYYAELLDHLDLPEAPRVPQLATTADEDQRWRAWRADHGVPADARLAMLCAGASYGGSKLWLPERFAALARRLQEDLGLLPVFLAGPAEVDLIRGIVDQCGALAAIDPVLPVDLLKPMLRDAEVLVTTDTGPRHVALAFDRPVVCLLGPTDRRYTDYCLDRQIVIRRDLECSPCQRKICPLGHHDCMRKIEVDEVVGAVRELIRARP